jgi:hypothetical protein
LRWTRLPISEALPTRALCREPGAFGIGRERRKPQRLAAEHARD